MSSWCDTIAEIETAHILAITAFLVDDFSLFVFLFFLASFSFDTVHTIFQADMNVPFFNDWF